MTTRFRRGLPILVLALACTACDEDALRMAREARQILSSYERELEKRIGLETTAYTRQAQVMAQAHREQLLSNLEQERLERARTVALDLIENRRPVTRWREPLRDYAKADYTVQRELLLHGLEGDGQMFARLQALQVDKQKIAALGRALEALTEKTSTVDQLRQLATFASDTKTAFDLRACEALAAQLKEAQAAVAAAGTNAADKKRAEASVAAVTKVRADKGCK